MKAYDEDISNIKVNANSKVMTKVTKVTKVKIKVKGQISGHNLIAPHIEDISEYFIVLR